MYERLERQDRLLIETNLIVRKLAAVQQVDVSEIPGVDDLPPLPPPTPSGTAASSPNLAVAAMTLDDQQSNVSSRSSVRSDRPGAYECSR